MLITMITKIGSSSSSSSSISGSGSSSSSSSSSSSMWMIVFITIIIDMTGRISAGPRQGPRSFSTRGLLLRESGAVADVGVGPPPSRSRPPPCPHY